MFARRARMNRRGIGERKGGSAPAPAFSPDNIAGLLGWYDAQFAGDITMNETPDPDTVSAWLDHHTSATDLAQATPSIQPDWLPTGWDGATLPAVKFYRSATRNGNLNNQAIGTTFDDNAAWTMFCVYDFDATPTADEAVCGLGGASSNNPWAIVKGITSGAIVMQQRDDAAVNSTLTSNVTTATTAGKHIVAAVRPVAWAGAKLRLDGVDVSGARVTGANGTTTFGKFAVGGLQRPAGNVFSANARIGACLLYSGALSDADCALVEAYLQARWGTPALP